MWFLLSALDWFQHPLARAAVLMAVILLLLAGAVQLARSFRGRVNQGEASSTDLLTKFRDLHSQGGLSDEEFRTIKSRLATQFQSELNDSDQKG